MRPDVVLFGPLTHLLFFKCKSYQLHEQVSRCLESFGVTRQTISHAVTYSLSLEPPSLSRPLTLSLARWMIFEIEFMSEIAIQMKSK